MQNQRGFVGVGLLVAIIAGALIVGGGLYYFYAKNPLTVISPNGGEVIQKGTVQTIRWSYNGSQTNRNTRVFIQKGPDENAQFTQSIASVSTTPGQEQTYEWKVPSDFPDGSDYKIEVDLEKTSNSDRLYFDLSDGQFAISSNESNAAQNKPVTQDKAPAQNKSVTQNNIVSIDQPSCSDSDNGDDYYVKGQVSLVDPMTVREEEGVRVLSSNKVRVEPDSKNVAPKEMGKGDTYSVTALDEVTYSKAGSQESLLVDMPTKLTVTNIHFIGIGNRANSASITKEIIATDQCIGDVLIENSCVGGINTGYLCAKGCIQGVCIK